VDSLADVYIDQWDRSRPNRRSCHARPEKQLKRAIIFYPTVGSRLNFYKSF
jgi:hypothetical protein